MSSIAVLRRRAEDSGAGGAPTRRWHWPHYLAAIGAPILFWELWTVIAWLTDGPSQITDYRDPGSASWWAARVVEALALSVAIPVIFIVIRGCIRERRLTFDGMFIICGLSAVWTDVDVNFYEPGFVVSSNFVNLNYMMGHMPFVVNPDAGRVADPLLVTIPMFTGGLLAGAMGAGWAVRRARARWPTVSKAKLVLMICAMGAVFDIAFEVPIVLLHLWGYAGTDPALPLGAGIKFPYIEIFVGGAFFVVPALVRVFKDDSGRTVVERHLQHLKPAPRTAISVLALYAIFQFAGWVLAAPAFLAFPYQKEWPEVPPAVVSGVCDAPGMYGTRYGPCPGTPGSQIPGRDADLAGDAP